MSDEILVTRADGIVSVVLNRAERRNAINEAMVATLAALFESLADDIEARVVTISAAGDHFSAGGDIKDIASVLTMSAEARSDHFQMVVRRDSMRLFLAMARLPQPVVLGVRGHVIGAAVQMAALADLVVASETARFSIPQVDLAHTVDHGESWALPRKIGQARAMQMCLLAENVDAAQAERFGLVNWVVPDDELDPHTDRIARRIATSPPVAARGMKALLQGSAANSLEEQFERENRMIGEAVATTDFVEAITAFTQKRAPIFTGH